MAGREGSFTEDRTVVVALRFRSGPSWDRVEAEVEDARQILEEEFGRRVEVAGYAAVGPGGAMSRAGTEELIELATGPHGGPRSVTP